jgi:hypothetical protein
MIVGSGPYERAKQSYLAEDYAAIISACVEEIAANWPHLLENEMIRIVFLIAHSGPMNVLSRAIWRRIMLPSLPPVRRKLPPTYHIHWKIKRSELF